MRFVSIVIMFAAILLTQPTLCAPAPLSLYTQGDYEAAIAAGTAEKDGAGFTLAARAALAIAMMKDTPCLDCLKRAEALARRAIAIDAGIPDAQVFLALALGYEARIEGTVTAKIKGYAEQAKSSLDTALAKEPRNALALAALGGWHIEIVRNGGARLAKWMYGAEIDKGLAQFHKAFEAAPDNPLLPYQFALSLAGYDQDRFRHEIEESLAASLRIAPRTAFERFSHARAAELLDAVRKGNRETIDRLVKRNQGYP